jgi:hypothetical protein
MAKSSWVKRWNDWIAPEPELPGVWRRRDGGFRIRGRTRDPKTNERRAVNRALPECKRAREAAIVLASEVEKIGAGAERPATGSRPRFDSYAVTIFERKLRDKRILSASGRATWSSILETHLIPAFGPILIDRLTRDDIERWKTSELLAPRVHTKDEKRTRKLAGGRYSPNTVNKILAVLRQITAEASDEFGIADACRRVEDVSKRGHRTYTHEDPNALRPADVPRFLAEARTRYPEHFAFALLGFTTGLRPSSLRPLRRRGPNADIKWETGELLVRRSHTNGAEVMDATKTDRDQVIALDKRQLEALRWHCDRLDRENERRAKRHPHLAESMAASELLFPAPPAKWNRGGGFRSMSCLEKMFQYIGELLELGYDVTPRCMRRTYQDLCRAANVADIVTRAISGHATLEMQRHYSTVSGDEMRAGLAKVYDIATGQERAAA